MIVIQSPAMADQDTLRVVRANSTLGQQVADRIREAIFEMHFKPGDRLVERYLCEQTGVSRTLVREALRGLEAEGLVQIVPHRGPMVATLSPAEVRDTWELRAVLEGYAAASFAENADVRNRRELHRALDELERTYKSEDIKTWLPARTRFYDVLLEGAGNSALSTVLQMIHGRSTLLRALTLHEPGRAAKSIAELRAFMKCVDNHDPAGASQALRQHILSALEATLHALEHAQTTRSSEGRWCS